jgi:putative ATP-dependent endonuclease of OLD family
MRLSSLGLKNFRCFTDELIKFDTYTALVGANNAGKSALIGALDIFFRSNPKNIPITIDDFFKRDADRELEIILTFSDLTDEAAKEFDHYVRSGELTFLIRARIENGSARASLHGIRLANPQFAPFFEKESAGEKKEYYGTLQEKYGFPKWTNQAQAAETLRAYENENKAANMPLRSDDKAFGVEGPIPKLRQFIDFVYIPAVKDAGDEAIEARNTAFSRLIDRAVRAKLKVDERIEKIRMDARIEIEQLAKDHQEVLGNLATRMETEYRKFNSSDSKLYLEWGQFDDKSLELRLPAIRLQVSDDLIRNSITKFGHGTQRNYLMALLMVSTSYDFTDLQTIIIACEEPELYQHPPQARILAKALFALASNQSQIIVTTHSPYFVTAKSFENVRLVRRTPTERSKVYNWSADENCSLIAKAKGEEPIGAQAALAAINQFLQPQMNEMFFAQHVVFVEGDEDRAILDRYLQLAEKNSQLLAIGMHIVPVSGKGNLINALSIARGMEIPYFAIFDGDMDGAKADSVALNKAIFSVIGYDGPGSDGLLTEHLFSDSFCVWKDSFQKAICENVPNWMIDRANVCVEFGWTTDRLGKNPMVMEATLERVFKSGKIDHLEALAALITKRFLGAEIIAAGS